MANPSSTNDQENFLKQQIEALKSEAKELNEKLLNLRWKIKRTDFLAFYEDKEREEQLKRIKDIEKMVDAYEKQSTGVDADYEEKTKLLNILQASDIEYTKEIEHLKSINQKNESTIAELNRSINVLKNRNAAMMTKLKKQKQNFDDQIKNLTEQMQ